MDVSWVIDVRLTRLFDDLPLSTCEFGCVGHDAGTIALRR